MSESSNSRGGASALELARAAYRGISLYSPDRTPCRIDLSDNTNLFGVPPAALRALRAASEGRVTRYPSLYSNALKEAIARYIGVEPDCVVTGCGSDDVLDSAIRAFTEPGACVATSDPSFAMIPLFARMNGLEAREVPLRDDMDPDAGALIDIQAAVTYICSPNNPTGNMAARSTVDRVATGVRGVFVLDEAYAEFAPGSFAARAPDVDGCLAVRTFSKAFGLAGMRIGYAVGSPELVAEVEKSRGPYKVNSLAEEVALTAMTEDLQWVRERAAEAIENRDRFAGVLRDIGLSPLRSHANFLLVPVADAKSVGAAMRARGVAVRPFQALPRVGDALRISIGPWEMLEETASVLESALP